MGDELWTDESVWLDATGATHHHDLLIYTWTETGALATKQWDLFDGDAAEPWAHDLWSHQYDDAGRNLTTRLDSWEAGEAGPDGTPHAIYTSTYGSNGELAGIDEDRGGDGTVEAAARYTDDEDDRLVSAGRDWSLGDGYPAEELDTFRYDGACVVGAAAALDLATSDDGTL